VRIQQEVRLRRESNSHAGGKAARIAVVSVRLPPAHAGSAAQDIRTAITTKTMLASADAADERRQAQARALKHLEVLQTAALTSFGVRGFQRVTRKPLRRTRASAAPRESQRPAPLRPKFASSCNRAMPREAGAPASTTCSLVSVRARPNPSVEARPNGNAPSPPPGCAYHPSGGLGASPSAPPHLER